MKLEQILPHKPPMVLLDRLLVADNDSAMCEVSISPRSPFYDHQLAGIPAYVGIEYMAQTIAAYSGALSQREGSEPKVGFLLGSRKYKPSVAIYKQGQTLQISVRKLLEDSSGLSVFNCEIIDQDGMETLVRAKLNVFQPVEVEAWMQEKS